MISKSKRVYATTVVALSIGLLALLSGCPDNGVGATEEDGTITVRLTGADAHNGEHFYYAVGAAGDDLSDPANWLGVAPTAPTITGGTVECITVDFGTDDPATFTGGESYDASGMIDADLSGDLTSGDYTFGPETVVVDGDTILNLVYPTDFTLAPEPSIFGTWTNASVTWEVGTLTDVVMTFNSDGSFAVSYQSGGANTQTGTFSPSDPPANATITMTVVASSGPNVPPPGGDDWYLRYSNLTYTTIDIEFDGNGDGFEGPDTFQKQ